MASSTEAPPSAEVATASLVPPLPAATDEGAASLVPPSPAAIDEAAASLVSPPPATSDEAAASLFSPPPADTDEVAASLVPPLTDAADEAVTSLVHPPPTAAVEAAASLVPNGNELTLASGSVETNGAVSNGGGAGGEGSSGETLERAAELYEKGLKALKDEDFFEAVDCLSQALEIRAAHHGELAPECAMSYYKYGCALLYKAQEESDPLGVVPKSNPKSTWKDKASTSVDENTSSKTSSVSDSNQDSLSKIEEEEEGRWSCVANSSVWCAQEMGKKGKPVQEALPLMWGTEEDQEMENVENELGCKHKYHISDIDGEYFNEELECYCAENGIRR